MWKKLKDMQVLLTKLRLSYDSQQESHDSREEFRIWQSVYTFPSKHAAPMGAWEHIGIM